MCVPVTLAQFIVFHVQYTAPSGIYQSTVGVTHFSRVVSALTHYCGVHHFVTLARLHHILASSLRLPLTRRTYHSVRDDGLSNIQWLLHDPNYGSGLLDNGIANGKNTAGLANYIAVRGACEGRHEFPVRVEGMCQVYLRSSILLPRTYYIIFQHMYV